MKGDNGLLEKTFGFLLPKLSLVFLVVAALVIVAAVMVDVRNAAAEYRERDSRREVGRPRSSLDPDNDDQLVWRTQGALVTVAISLTGWLALFGRPFSLWLLLPLGVVGWWLAAALVWDRSGQHRHPTVPAWHPESGDGE